MSLTGILVNSNDHTQWRVVDLNSDGTYTFVTGLNYTSLTDASEQALGRDLSKNHNEAYEALSTQGKAGYDIGV